MSATVINMFDFLRRHGSPSSDPSLRPEQSARDQVTTAIGHSVSHTVLCQARARAVRHVIGGRSVAYAVRSAVAWARCARHNDGPEAA